MANYRLELWFNFDDGSKGWGVVSHPNNGSKRAVMTVTDDVVTIPDGPGSTLDIKVFDASSSGTHSLDWIDVDFEIAAVSQPTQTNNPVADAPNLRSGETGSQFSSNPSTGTPKIYSYPGGQRSALEAWDSNNRFESLSVGNYTFTATLKSTLTGGNNPQQTFTIDPEIDVESPEP